MHKPFSHAAGVSPEAISALTEAFTTLSEHGALGARADLATLQSALGRLGEKRATPDDILKIVGSVLDLLTPERQNELVSRLDSNTVLEIPISTWRGQIFPAVLECQEYASQKLSTRLEARITEYPAQHRIDLAKALSTNGQLVAMGGRF